MDRFLFIFIYSFGWNRCSSFVVGLNLKIGCFFSLLLIHCNLKSIICVAGEKKIRYLRRENKRNWKSFQWNENDAWCLFIWFMNGNSLIKPQKDPIERMFHVTILTDENFCALNLFVAPICVWLTGWQLLGVFIKLKFNVNWIWLIIVMHINGANGTNWTFESDAS